MAVLTDSGPRVVHVKRDRYDVYIGRPGPWGNPLQMGKEFTRSECIEHYKRYMAFRPDLRSKARKELRGKVLGCWCAPRACHGDVLLEIANREESA